MDRPGDEMLTTYISSDVAQQYRYRRQLEELIEQAKQCAYVPPTCGVASSVAKPTVDLSYTR